MGREGITYELVAAAADKLIAAGKKATNRNIRDELGKTGSMTNVAEFARKWRFEHTQTLAPVRELSADLVQTLNVELSKAESAARAPVAEELAQAQEDYNDLSMDYDALEAERNELAREVEKLTTERDDLAGTVNEQVAEIRRLTWDVQQAHQALEQARTEVAEHRYKVDMQTSIIAGRETTIEALTAARDNEAKLRVAAEKDVAAKSAKLDAVLEQLQASRDEAARSRADADRERQAAATERGRADKLQQINADARVAVAGLEAQLAAREKKETPRRRTRRQGPEAELEGGNLNASRRVGEL